jgi:hypothetical protein
MQAGLRSYIIYDILPVACIAVEIEDDGCEPHVREGEFVVVDTEDRDPIHGELFLMQWESGRRAVVELSLRDGYAGPVWWVHSHNHPETREQWTAWITDGRTGGYADGPYAADGEQADYFHRKLLGRVVGILEPDFRLGRAWSASDD